LLHDNVQVDGTHDDSAVAGMQGTVAWQLQLRQYFTDRQTSSVNCFCINFDVFCDFNLQQVAALATATSSIHYACAAQLVNMSTPQGLCTKMHDEQRKRAAAVASYCDCP
jgi:hypothetical protein